jgi:hypothetical protein
LVCGPGVAWDGLHSLHVVQKAGAAALIIINADGKQWTAPGAANASEYAVRAVLDESAQSLTKLQSAPLPIVMVQRSAESALRAAKTVQMSRLATAESRFDPSMLCLVLLALVIVIVSLRVTADHDAAEHASRRAEGDTDDDEATSAQGDIQHGPVRITLRAGLQMLVFMSVLLGALYFFYRYLVYVVMFIFCVAGTLSVAQLMHAYVPLPRLCSARRVRVPFPGGVSAFVLPAVCVCVCVCVCHCLYLTLLGVSAQDAVFAMTGAGMSVWWFVTRHSALAWIPQDLLGAALVVTVLQGIRFDSFKVGVPRFRG